MFHDGISKYYKSESRKGKAKGRDTSLMSGGLEAWKLAPLLALLAFCLGSDGEILPNSSQ